MPTIEPIAHIHSEFPTKFGIPRQSNLVPGLKSTVVFTPDYRNPDALRGLDAFTHIWLIWGFSESPQGEWSPTVRPPRLGGNTRMGVFATRAPYRPNGLGISAVRLERVEAHPEYGLVLHVRGADLMNGTPIYDIKPYITYADSHPDASGGFAQESPKPILAVNIPERFLETVSEEQRGVLKDILAQDPRPSYQRDPQRIYGVAFGGFNIKFTVDGFMLTVIDIIKIPDEGN